MRARVAVVAVAVAVVAPAAAAAPELGATVRCAPTEYEIDFDPRRSVVVRTDGREVAAASFAYRRLSRACARVGYALSGDDALGRRGVYAPLRLRCVLPRPVRLHVHPIRGDGDRVVGSVLSIAAGRDVQAVFVAVLKNRGDAAASRSYYARRWCRTVSRIA